jgi:hypothetical protein
MHPGEVPETLVLAVPLFDGGAQFVGGTDLCRRKTIRGADQNPIVGLAVPVAFAAPRRLTALDIDSN